jgi:hypothetical protein
MVSLRIDGRVCRTHAYQCYTFKVAGSQTIAGPAGPVDCWVVTTDYNQPGPVTNSGFAKSTQLMCAPGKPGGGRQSDGENLDRLAGARIDRQLVTEGATGKCQWPAGLRPAAGTGWGAGGAVFDTVGLPFSSSTWTKISFCLIMPSS